MAPSRRTPSGASNHSVLAFRSGKPHRSLGWARAAGVMVVAAGLGGEAPAPPPEGAPVEPHPAARRAAHSPAATVRTLMSRYTRRGPNVAQDVLGWVTLHRGPLRETW